MYIGKLPEFAIHPSKFFSGNGTAMTITLDHAPPNRASILVFIDGVRQDTNAYTISGTSLTFTGTVPSGTDNIQVIHLGVTASAFVPDVDTIVTNMLTNGSVTSPKLDTNIDIAGTLDVTGVLTADSNASVAGNLTVDTDTLYVDAANDRVGINKTNPSTALDVSGNVTATAYYGDGSNLTGISTTTTLEALTDTTITSAASGEILQYSGSAWVNDNTLVVDTANTRIGINNTSPSKTLEVNGTIKSYQLETEIYSNETQVDHTYSIPSGSNALSVGPITVSNGTTITVPTGSVWHIL